MLYKKRSVRRNNPPIFVNDEAHLTFNSLTRGGRAGRTSKAVVNAFEV